MNQRNRSWLRLVMFCVAAVLAAALFLSVLFASAAVALTSDQAAESQAENPASPETVKELSGMVTDSYCGARHGRNTGKTAAECTHFCVGRGAKYMLVSGEKSYTLAGNEIALRQLAGQRVLVSGTLAGDRIQVESIAPMI